MKGTLLQTFQQVKGERENDQHGPALFVVNCLGLNCKPKRTSFWCEDCGKALCITPCFKIYHTKIDYKLHAFNFRQDGTGTVVVQAVDGNNSDNNL